MQMYDVNVIVSKLVFFFLQTCSLHNTNTQPLFNSWLSYYHVCHFVIRVLCFHFYLIQKPFSSAFITMCITSLKPNKQYIRIRSPCVSVSV